MIHRTNGHQQQPQQNGTRSSKPASAAPCTSPWTEAYQFGFAEDRQRAEDDQDCQQPTHDALSQIYNRGYA
ncbi:MAG: hypothetical protein IAE80_08355 [Anaerolinea sp.]|nr:hypothetical protein [Anaerolinea sp.]